MRRFYSRNCFYSNCLIVALMIRLRVGGSLKFTVRFRPLGIHFSVQKNRYIIDFSPVCFRSDFPLWKQIVFYGTLRVRKAAHNRYFI
jgi:hypothetical protein